MPTSTDPDPVSDTFAAVANPTRRRILDRLAGGEATVNELAAPFDMTLPAVSKHIAVLERAGLIERRRHGTSRPCVLARQRLREAMDWAASIEAEWEQRLDRLEARLETSATTADRPGGTPT